MKTKAPDDPALMLLKTVMISFVLFFFLWITLIWMAILGEPVCDAGSNVCIDVVSAINKSNKK